MITETNVTAAPFNADPTGVSDATAAIQSAISSLGANGGRVVIPVGQYLISGAGISVPINVNLAGYGRFATILTSHGADINIVNLNGNYCSLEDMAVLGPITGSPGNSAITISSSSVGFDITRVNAWGGAWGINDFGGVDGTFYGVFPAGTIGGLQSKNGANKYQSCKFDGGAIAGQSRGIYFYSTINSVIENEFDQCDFSGNFVSGGVCFNDSSAIPQSIARFTACTFGAHIALLRAQAIMFAACEMPFASSFTLAAGVGCAVTGSYSINGATTYPSCAKAGNINIS